MSEVFMRRLRALNGDAKETLSKALKTGAEPVLLRSAFDLPSQQQAAIQSALNETFAACIPIRFETSPDLVSGIELTSNGQRLSWSIADYLVSFEKTIAEILSAKDRTDSKCTTMSA
jgi:F-type H+-transporting ATPase subunit b